MVLGGALGVFWGIVREFLGSRQEEKLDVSWERWGMGFVVFWSIYVAGCG